MSKREKIIEKWYENTPTEENVDTVIAVLKFYFEDIKWKGTSHIQIKDKRLNATEFRGHFTVPVKNGQKVNRIYLKNIAIIINQIIGGNDE